MGKQKYFTEEEKREAHRKTCKKYRQTHKKEIKNYNQIYTKNKKKERNLKSKEYYQKHKNEYKIYRKINKENISNYHKNYYQNYKEEKLLYAKKYRENHKEKEKEYRELHKKERRIYNNNKLKTDIDFKLAKRLRIRLWGAIRSNQKSGSAVKDLGCSIPELKLYLESKFQEGMSWDNWSYTGWHIDHIIPLDSFNLQNREEFLKACHYTNLQPLWAKENLKKNNK